MDLSDQKTQVMLLVIAAVLGGIYVWFTYLYSPRADEISQLQSDRDQLQMDIQRLELEVARLPQVELALEQATQRWNEVLISFPNEPREEEVIANINTAEQLAGPGLYIRSLTKGARRTRPLYFEQDWTVNMVGEYAQLSRFIEHIGSMSRRMSVDRLKVTHPSALQVGSGGGPAPRDQEVVITCTVTTYIVRVGG
ncbi:type 4a pilus biogenesis protein PilO [Gemmatimonadota bacterium]